MMEDSLFAYVKWCPVKQAASQFPMKDAAHKNLTVVTTIVRKDSV